jgi:DNA-binding PadR family transcriptional regulator
MKRENRTSYAVLGVLSYGPRSGYDIRKLIDSTVGHFWSESYGQLYPILKELVREGLATVHHEEQQSKPDRKVYAITPQGEAVLKAWLATPVEMTRSRNELLLKLFFGGKVEPEVTRDHLQRFTQALEQQIGVYQAIETEVEAEAATEPDQVYRTATLSFGIYVSNALLAWSKDTQAQLDALAGGPKAADRAEDRTVE